MQEVNVSPVSSGREKRRSHNIQPVITCQTA